MNVTLKKASELARAALTAAKAIEAKTTTDISAYSDVNVNDTIAAARGKLVTAIVRQNDLTTANFTIRNLIAESNHSTGVTRRLGEIAGLDEKIARTKALLDHTEYDSVDTDDMGAIERRVELARGEVANPEARRFGTVSSIKLNLINAAFKEQLTDELRVHNRNRTALKDEVAGINLTTKIELPEEVTRILREEKIID